MRDIPLYYPYTHVRDDAWLKAAALYWPRLARIVPPGYPNADSETARMLHGELGFFVDVNPARRAPDVAEQFRRLLQRRRDALRERFGGLESFPDLADQVVNASPIRVPPSMGGLPFSHPGDGRGHPARLLPSGDFVEWVHIGKLPGSAADELIEAGLGVPTVDGQWVAMHSRLAGVYIAALADRIAQANDMPVITDQPEAHGVVNGWDVETMARVLLTDPEQEPPASHSMDDIAALYATVAIRAVVPRDLDRVPVERIVRVRRTLAAEFDAFRQHVDTLNEQLGELARIEDPAILRAQMEVLVGRDLLRPMEDLARGLKDLLLDPVFAVLGLKSPPLPPAASAAGVSGAVGETGQAAVRLVTSSVQTRQQTRERRRSAPGYLLGLRRELNPTGVVEQVRQLFRRASTPSTPTTSRPS